ncbi:MAG: DUF2333 family protein [Gammaproteobacteria bacterium]|nr:DUF2333 family protein [Gammaproteobacteria bacterium]
MPLDKETIIQTANEALAALKEKKLSFQLVALGVPVIGLIFLIYGSFLSTEPEPFTLSELVDEQESVVTGSATTLTLIKTVETLLNKRGGYLTNDIMPPNVWLDNIPNWEFGVLVQARDLSLALRNDFSRSQSQSTEDKALMVAQPQLHFDSNSWVLPDTEGEYQKGIKALKEYLQRLTDPKSQNAQFYARADNLHDWLNQVEKRLGSLSQRLSASTGQVRINTDLAGDSAAVQSTQSAKQIEVKTAWAELDDVFYEARGSAWALMHILKAVEIDFAPILKKKNALISLRQIIRELEASQEPLFSPMVLNGSGFGLFANHSLVMASYLSRANSAIIDLRQLLQQG